ncbi:hypothetical protein PQ456_01485 [Paenibacillus kyungheensis]|uniref:DUF4367 domain-containing protein n=1 Tax=Paenibacillus kyungheensis TaxID=1452732 RepID=A0AAX3M2V1_9BACL|nr:hypothetical protein [Paenibacillus kyungheensis]WCT56228.1 hypothetical protein PQ456_01485 [Paenibacillus kyungheensis]
MNIHKWIATSVIAGVLLTGATTMHAATTHSDNVKVKATTASSTTTNKQYPVTNVDYSSTQLKKITQAFAGFDGFETPYVPTRMIKGDAFRKVSGVGDGVTFLFKYMTVSVSPRDYSYDYKGTTVILPNSNQVKAKWYKPDKVDMLTFKLDDRYVTISSPYHLLGKAKLEQVAVDVAKYVPVSVPK